LRFDFGFFFPSEKLVEKFGDMLDLLFPSEKIKEVEV